jgi:transcriptional regulator with XRE-family HTH domain
MAGTCTNIYQIGREHSKKQLTRAQAAEYLFIDNKTLRNYEHNDPRPKSSTVLDMVELYDFPALVWLHCYELFPEHMPYIKITDLKTAALNMVDNVGDFNDLIRLLIKISKDNEVDVKEKPDMDKILKHAMSVASAALTLVFCYKEDNNA